MILVGLFQVSMAAAILATTGVIFAACYMLWMFQRVMFLELKNPKNEKLEDMTPRELTIMVPLIILIFWIGFYTKPFTETFDASVEHLITQVDPANFKGPPVEHGSSPKVLEFVKLKGGESGNLN